MNLINPKLLLRQASIDALWLLARVLSAFVALRLVRKSSNPCAIDLGITPLPFVVVNSALLHR